LLAGKALTCSTPGERSAWLKIFQYNFRLNNFTEVNKNIKKCKTCHKEKRTNKKTVIIRRESPAFFFVKKKWIFKLLKKNMPRTLVHVYL